MKKTFHIKILRLQFFTFQDFKFIRIKVTKQNNLYQGNQNTVKLQVTPKSCPRGLMKSDFTAAGTIKTGENYYLSLLKRVI